MQNPIPFPVLKNKIPLSVVAPGVECLQVIMVNVFFISHTEDNVTRWFLVDAGLGYCAARIKKASVYLFGEDNPPQAILLTHGHADHVGAVADLAAAWNVPVYAHPMEMPYLIGKSYYPPPDPTVGGGAMTWLSSTFPSKPIDISGSVKPFPEDGTVPGLPGWQVIHTPGHTPGHVSFFRESDRTLLAGDAFTTVKQESFFAVLSQEQEVNGPPAYFTSDWQAAQQSVQVLADLKPGASGCGHGKPMHGVDLQYGLETLALHFDELAVPKHGRYVSQPALTDEQGVISLPPPADDTPEIILGKLGIGALAGVLAGYWGKELWNDRQ